MKYQFENDPPPRLIPKRKCACGCGNNFQPRRRDQIYINKQHADDYHNRKKQLVKKVDDEILRRNDRILEKLFHSGTLNPGFTQAYLELFFLQLKIKGFDHEINVVEENENGENCYYTYNHYYQIYKLPNSEIEMVRIFKR
ncbi:hypothetical protein [Gaetbulibacter aestuarii]|uniref:Uncharacterized protein n=1 Tax=Gaetbulibacter aestuarii TaxID=1502358 RepID=A0ABW7N2T0_9FLAO